MNSVKVNAAANLLGSIWGALIGIAFVPLFLHLLGAPQYGLVSFYSVLLGVLSVADIGLATAASRHLARISEDSGLLAKAARLLSTLEVCFLLGGLFIALCLAGFAEVIATKWLRTTPAEATIAVPALRLMGLALAIQWPISLYTACMMGLQMQIQQNVFQALLTTARYSGAALLLLFAGTTVSIFFTWQICVSVIGVVAARGMLARRVEFRFLTFSLSHLREIWSMAVSVAAVSLLNLLLFQLDKVIVSKLFPLEMFAYYMLAWTLASSIMRIAGPIYNAVFPRMAQLTAAQRVGEMQYLFTAGSAFMAIAIVPLGLALSIDGHEVIWLWTGNGRAAEHAHDALIGLAGGVSLTALASLIGAVLVAEGTLVPLFRISLVTVVLQAPLTYLLASRYGLSGAGAAFFMLCVGYLVAIILVAKDCPIREAVPGFIKRILFAPTLAGGLVWLLVAELLKPQHTRLFSVVLLAAGYCISAVAILAVVPVGRRVFLNLYRATRL